MAKKENKKETANIELNLPSQEVRLPKIENEQELDKRLEELSTKGRKLLEYELRRAEKIAAAKASFQKRIDNSRNFISKLFKSIMQYAEKNRETILPENRKSVELTHGTIGWRKDPPSISLIVSEEEAVKKLKALRKRKYIKVEETVNIEALLKEPDVARALSSIIAYNDGSDHFFIKPAGVQAKFSERIKALAKKVAKTLRKKKK